MFPLLATTVVTSAVDSLNPIAITQQFVLQGLVKKAYHIWYFIISIAITNFTWGLLAYFGLAALLGRFMRDFLERYATLLFGIEALSGVGCMIAFLIIIRKLRATPAAEASEEEEENSQSAFRAKSVSPAALTGLGVLATLSELTTALPYFAFIAILCNYTLSVAQTVFILIVYNIIYSLPLMIMYFVYIKSRQHFDSFYLLIKSNISKWSAVLVPGLVGALGLVLLGHSASFFLG
ncbi:GAP family protein [Oscillospiraceae bacterium MB08-C2-2]|nr:GAP family protein [Oscillospiraceae bacterium MB08-C2-2]